MALGEILLTANEVQKSFGDRTILKDTSFTIHDTARIGVIGPNGTGKSTFMRILAGGDTEYTGEIKRAPNIRIGYIEQEPTLDNEKNCRENVELGLERILKLIENYNDVCTDYSTQTDEDAQKKLLGSAGSSHGICGTEEHGENAVSFSPWSYHIATVCLNGGR